MRVNTRNFENGTTGIKTETVSQWRKYITRHYSEFQLFNAFDAFGDIENARKAIELIWNCSIKPFDVFYFKYEADREILECTTIGAYSAEHAAHLFGNDGVTKEISHIE